MGSRNNNNDATCADTALVPAVTGGSTSARSNANAGNTEVAAPHDALLHTDNAIGTESTGLECDEEGNGAAADSTADEACCIQGNAATRKVDDSKDIATASLQSGLSHMSTVLSLKGTENIIAARASMERLYCFENAGLLVAMRKFLYDIELIGETHSQSRIIDRFAERYHTCNPTLFKSPDDCGALAFAIVLLNTDLHSGQVKTRMSQSAFIKNVMQLKDVDHEFPGFKLSTLKQIYSSLKKAELTRDPALVSEEVSRSTSLAESDVSFGTGTGSRQTSRTITVDDEFRSNNTPVFIKGPALLKWLMISRTKRAAPFKRSWKLRHLEIRGTMLLIHESETSTRPLMKEDLIHAFANPTPHDRHLHVIELTLRNQMKFQLALDSRK